jgi:MOSC domain-containing protein YiiM
VKEIYIAEKAGGPMIAKTKTSAESNKGLVGDRYHSAVGRWSDSGHKPDFNLTLIEDENIAEFHRQGISLAAHEFRRNIVTTGINLNELEGRRFLIGNVTCQGIRLCEPCLYLEKLTGIKLVKTMTHKGGLRVQLLTDGRIEIGDPITISDRPASSNRDEAEYHHS